MSAIIEMDLQLFAEGAAGGTAAGDAGTAAGGTPAAAAPDAQTQTPGPDAQGQTETPEERAKRFEAYKAEFKAEINAERKKMIQDRLRKANGQNKALTDQLTALRPMIDNIAKQYGVDPDDPAALVAAFENDDRNLEALAYKEGMSVDELRMRMQYERKNQALEAQLAEQERLRQFAAWDAEAQALQQIFPTFDLPTELENDGFVRMLDAGVPMQTAYEVIHKDELIRGAMQYTAQETAKKVTNRVMANGARPAEAGLKNGAAAVTTANINNMSRAQMEDAKRRALRGEYIDFVSHN